MRVPNLNLIQVKPVLIKQMTLHITPMAVEKDILPSHWLLDPHCKEIPGLLHYHSLDVFVQLNSMYSALS